MEYKIIVPILHYDKNSNYVRVNRDLKSIQSIMKISNNYNLLPKNKAFIL